jgi:hypothetical protein
VQSPNATEAVLAIVTFQAGLVTPAFVFVVVFFAILVVIFLGLQSCALARHFKGHKVAQVLAANAYNSVMSSSASRGSATGSVRLMSELRQMDEGSRTDTDTDYVAQTSFDAGPEPLGTIPADPVPFVFHVQDSETTSLPRHRSCLAVCSAWLYGVAMCRMPLGLQATVGESAIPPLLLLFNILCVLYIDSNHKINVAINFGYLAIGNAFLVVIPATRNSVITLLVIFVSNLLF